MPPTKLTGWQVARVLHGTRLCVETQIRTNTAMQMTVIISGYRLIKNTMAPKTTGETKKPIFEKEKVTVVFVLGGPGAGMSPAFLPAFALSPDSAMPSLTYIL